MLIIPVKEGENIERALKKFKKKFERTGTMRALRARQHYVKPCVARREAMKKAIYKNGLNLED
jgi:small subunit ribosomal protein S21